MRLFPSAEPPLLKLPLFRRLVLLWFVVELTALALPLLLPMDWYLALYLPEHASAQTTRFLNNELATIPDETLGWINKPNYSKGNWQIDGLGGRNHQPISITPNPELKRIIFLGSSLINGSNFVDNDETISAYLQSQANPTEIEAANFATMMYTLDQIYLQLRDHILRLKPDVIVIGLHEDPSYGLDNLYVPLIRPEEANMPFVKPMFARDESTTLALTLPPLAGLAKRDGQFIDRLRQQDAHFINLQRFAHLHTTPLLAGADLLTTKALNLGRYFTEAEQDHRLLRTLMQTVDTLAAKHQVKIIYAYLPTPRALLQGGIWRFMPDFYASRYQWLARPWPEQRASTQTTGPEVVNIRQAFRDQHHNNPMDLYADDGYHFSAYGNQHIAKAIAQALKDLDSLQE